jgi:hypothetical protein
MLPVQASASRVMERVSTDGVNEAFTGVDAIAADDVWAVGIRSDSAPLIKHWDGARWRDYSAPPGIRNLSGVDHVSSTDVWVGGQGGIMHWDGTAWTMSYVGRDLLVIESIVAVGPDDIWAAGFSMGRAGGIKMHWDGSRWTRVGKSQPDNWMHAIDADQGGDVWAVGDDGVQRWTGHSWKRFPGLLLWAMDVAVVSRSDVWIAGRDPQVGGDAAMVHWDGHDFTAIDVPTHGTSSELDAFSVGAAGDIWAVGKSTSPHTRPLIEHWNGSNWALVPAPSITHNGGLNAVSADAPDDAWSVGFVREHRFYASLLSFHWDGTDWTRVD